MDSQSSYVKLGARFLQGLLDRADCAHLPTRDLEARLLWRSLTLPRRSSTSSSLPVENGEGREGLKHGFPLHLQRFLIDVYGGHGLLLVKSVATKVVRSGGSVAVAGCVHATAHEAGLG